MNKNRTLLNHTLTVRPGNPLQGDVGPGEKFSIPGDKSLSHRAALFAAMAEGESYISNFLVSGVTEVMLTGLSVLGIPWQLIGNQLRVSGKGLRGLRRMGEQARIDCGNSGTTMRLLAGALATWNTPACLDGSPGLRRRPMQRIVEPLRKMGISIETKDGYAPLILSPVELPLKSIEYELPVASAQVKSCLLLAALSADDQTILNEPGPSRDHTERMLRSMGVEISQTQTGASHDSNDPIGNVKYFTRLTPPESKSLSPLNIDLPVDISAAAFIIVASLITPGSKVVLKGIGLNPTRTGLLDVLRSMGADIEINNNSETCGEPVGDVLVAHSSLSGVRVSGNTVVRMIDEFPAFAIAAAFADGLTIVRDAAELRNKESDRISALCTELRNIGVDVTETRDGFEILGGRPLRGGIVQSHGDHRLAMSLALAGLTAEKPVIVQGAEIIGESFPNFQAVLQTLGADITTTRGD